MGDIQTHASIATAVQATLPKGEQRLFFEVGNYLTDVSQFRDPYAHLGGKTRMWRIGRDEHPEGFLFAALDLYAGLDNYLDELMGIANTGLKEGTEGDPTTWRPDDGALAAWFRDVILVYSTERFHRQGVDKGEFRAVFDRHFTQYYPHEHMDFPPWPHGSALGGERSLTSEIDLADGSAKRRLLRYLDDQLEYVADLLTRVEKEWAQVAATSDNAAARRDLLASFGHASHALEDYFFHSNFVEFAWEGAHPGDPAPTRPLPPPTPQELDSFGPPVSDDHRQRSHHRRRRSPQANADDDALSTEGSAAATEIYTGQFGGNDIFFTFVDAIGHALTAGPPQEEQGPADLLRDGIRKVLFGTDEEQATALAQHNGRLKSGAYIRAAQAAQLAGQLEAFEVDAIRRACDRDLALAQSYGSIASAGTPLGILGMLQKMLAAARVAAKTSAEASAAIDKDAAHTIKDDRSDNGAAAEAIGSHTLMAKDSVRKEPLRVEAVNLATVAATTIGKTMASQLAAGPPAQPGGVDWAATLRSFVGHPEQAAGGADAWWKAALTAPDAGPAPGAPTLSPAAAFTERAAEPHRRALETKYEALSAVVNDQYRSSVNEAFVLDAALTGAILGGLSGMISGLVYGAIDGSPERSVGAGALGLLTGGVTGLLGSLLITGIGTAVDDSAGAVTGAVTSWAAAPVGSWFLAKGIAEAL